MFFQLVVTWSDSSGNIAVLEAVTLEILVNCSRCGEVQTSKASSRGSSPKKISFLRLEKRQKPILENFGFFSRVSEHFKNFLKTNLFKHYPFSLELTPRRLMAKIVSLNVLSALQLNQ